MALLVTNILPADTAVVGWNFWDKAHAVVVTGGAVDQGNANAFTERAFCLNELVKLSKIRCLDCNGFGHSDRDCQTREKLTALGKVSTIAGAIVAAGRKSVKDGRAGIIAARARPSTLSLLGNSKKREKKEESKNYRQLGQALITQKRFHFSEKKPKSGF